MELDSTLTINLQMEQQATLGQRLKSIRENAGLSARRFAAAIGIDPSQYSKTEKDQFGLSTTALAEVASTFNVDLNWLIAGEGSSIQEPESPPYARLQRLKTRPKTRVPFFDAPADAGNADSDMIPVTEPSGYISTGDLFGKCDAALRIRGNSMLQGYPPGTVLGLNRYQDSFIQPGELYVLETHSQRVFKRLFECDGERTDCYECYSDNNAVFAEGPRKGKPFYPVFYVPKDEVLRIWAVVGSAREHFNSVIIHATP